MHVPMLDKVDEKVPLWEKERITTKVILIGIQSLRAWKQH